MGNQFVKGKLVDPYILSVYSMLLKGHLWHNHQVYCSFR